MVINEASTLSEILEIDGAEAILHKHGVPCMTCPLAAQEINSLKLGQVSAIYQLDSATMIKELNINFIKKG